jgi:hypothetical protein
MFNARPAGPASAADAGDRPVRAPRRKRGARGLATGAGLLARVVRLVVSLVVLIPVAGILFVLLKANPGNSIVSQVHDWARSLAGPFDGMFSFNNPRVAVAVNWGIAAVVYLLVGGLIAGLIGRGRR